MPDEERDVLAPLPQRRQPDGEDAQAVVEVLAEAAVRHGPLEVAVGGGDDPHVHLAGPAGADALELAVLEDAEELRLDVEGELADLVEEERAPVGQLEAADLRRRSPR